MSFHKAFCPSLLERSSPSTGMARKEMEKTCTRWDIRPLIRGTLLSLCVYLSASTKCMLHIDVLENTLRRLDCSWSSEHNDITGPLIWDDIGWFNNEKSSRTYTSHMRRLHRNERLHMLTTSAHCPSVQNSHFQMFELWFRDIFIAGTDKNY